MSRQRRPKADHPRLPTAAWPLDKLVERLTSAGWAGTVLDGRPGGGLRHVLHALSALLPHDSAQGRVTVPQIADAAGLSKRWTATRLALLVDLGVIAWSPGGVRHGKPEPGWVRVSKRAVALLIRHAREHLDRRLMQRRVDTRDRLDRAGIRHARTQRRARTQRNPLSSHVELSSPLPLKGEEPGRGSAPVHQQSPPPEGVVMPQPLGTPCRVCNRPPERCEQAQRRVPLGTRHRYEASAPRSHQLVAPSHPRRHTSPSAAKRPWRELVAEAHAKAATLFDL